MRNDDKKSWCYNNTGYNHILSGFLYCVRSHKGVDDENIREMEYYLKQKECTQIMIDQSNGHNVKIPEDCPQY